METTPCAVLGFHEFLYRCIRTLKFITTHARPSIPISITITFSRFSLFHYKSRDIVNEEETDRSSRRVGRSSNDSYRTFLPSLYLFLSRGSPLILPQCGESLRTYLCSASLTPSPNGFLMRQHKYSHGSPPTQSRLRIS